MSITQDNRAAYKQLRGLIGWALLIAWIAYWWLHLESIRQAALLLPCEESGLDKAGDFLLGAGHACKAHINDAFNGGLFAAVLVSPLAFVVSHFGAIMIIAGGYAAAAASERKDAEDKQRAFTAEMEAISDRSRRENEAARQDNNRFEFITRLGAVDEQLVVLSGEKDDARIKLIELNVLQSLRDIHAKFRMEELRFLYAPLPSGIRTPMRSSSILNAALSAFSRSSGKARKASMRARRVR